MFGGHPSDVVCFKPKEKLSVVRDKIGQRRQCNICEIRKFVFRYNREEMPERNEKEDYYYADAKQLDICANCMENAYPKTEEFSGGCLFYITMYDYSHYYPCFPEMKRRLIACIQTTDIDIRKQTFKKIPLLNLIIYHNTMLEYMDLFNISFNEMLTTFLHNYVNSRQHFEEFGFGTKFPSVACVVYKFFEKFMRYVVRYRCLYRPRPKDLIRPTLGDYVEKEFKNSKQAFLSDYEKGRYDNELETYEYCLSCQQEINKNPNGICRSDDKRWGVCTYKPSEIWLWPPLHKQCLFENQKKGEFLSQFSYKTSINKETISILENFLSNYATPAEPLAEEMENLASTYNRAVNDDLFIYALTKFKDALMKELF